MKEKANQEMENASQTMFSHKLRRIPPVKTNNNRLIILLQPQVQGMVNGFVSFVETDPARVDVLSASYEEQEYHRRTRRGGQHHEMQWRRETENP